MNKNTNCKTGLYCFFLGYYCCYHCTLTDTVTRALRKKLDTKANTPTHACTHARARAHTHTHTHTHALSPIVPKDTSYAAFELQHSSQTFHPASASSRGTTYCIKQILVQLPCTVVYLDTCPPWQAVFQGGHWSATWKTGFYDHIPCLCIAAFSIWRCTGYNVHVMMATIPVHMPLFRSNQL